jgi:hypothetical protein
MPSVAEIQHRFDRAERDADRATLEDLIAEDFLSIGPKGFVLDKRQWIDRHDQFSYQALDTSELDVPAPMQPMPEDRPRENGKGSCSQNRARHPRGVSAMAIRRFHRWSP